MNRALLGVGAYGAGMLAAGVLAVALPARSGPAGPVLTVAPVVAPVTTPGLQPSPSPSGSPSGSPSATPSPAASVPQAAVGEAEGVVDAFAPTKLLLARGVDAPVVPAGVRDDGSLVVPADPDVVGWWTGGAQAGDAFGSVVVAGHVDSVGFGVGVMFTLHKARKGQVVTLQAGDRVQRYRISTTRRVKRADLADDPTIFAADGPHRLVLITCGGRFDPVAHRYEENVIVEADPV